LKNICYYKRQRNRKSQLEEVLESYNKEIDSYKDKISILYEKNHP
jgi:hypothetical protein